MKLDEDNVEDCIGCGAYYYGLTYGQLCEYCQRSADRENENCEEDCKEKNEYAWDARHMTELMGLEAGHIMLDH